MALTDDELQAMRRRLQNPVQVYYSGPADQSAISVTVGDVGGGNGGGASISGSGGSTTMDALRVVDELIRMRANLADLCEFHAGFEPETEIREVLSGDYERGWWH